MTYQGEMINVPLAPAKKKKTMTATGTTPKKKTAMGPKETPVAFNTYGKRTATPAKKVKLSESVKKGAGGKGKGSGTSPWLYAAGGALATLALQQVLGAGKKKTVNYNHYFGGGGTPYTPRW